MKTFLLFLAQMAILSGNLTAARPNILIILADDCTHNDLAVYGGKNAKTPNIDTLASQGLTFNRAYVSEAMCQPCRAELYTGQFPMRNGCAWNHSASRPGTRSLPQHLGALGYRVGLAGKSHVLPEEAYPFEKVPGFDPNCVRNPTQAHDLDGVHKFISRQKDQAFCLVVALVEPHVPWVMGDASQYPPKKIQLPPNIADTPKTRDDFSHYLAEITYMDGQVGQVLNALKESGHEEDTLVIFTSEQGSQFPGNKWTNWDTGLHTALIARWPGHVAPGMRTDAIVQYADVVPTLIELGGGLDKAPGTRFDGTSFSEVLFGKKSSHREYAYGVHNNIPEGPAYPIRTVSNGEYRYIRNVTPGEIYIEKHVMGIQGGGALNNPYWPTWVANSWNTPETYHLVKRYLTRPGEELYHTALDPYEMTNLATDPKHAATRSHLAEELDRWLAEQGDPGAKQDTHEAHQAAKRGEHLYFAKP
ncbi:putative sulfatase [Prosthecobacter fusiformis]|uniref:Putative sulfatase n=1 Tax=Prosthecobacter fusiformis TaxID=48464 RepID=A0A4R7RUE7_9BACT|nr:sulfatase [Prosthecobacter fusiformis]TDU69364.1 putative sulfatase [Prosthecobacter fusiformis]